MLQSEHCYECNSRILSYRNNLTSYLEPLVSRSSHHILELPAPVIGRMCSMLCPCWIEIVGHATPGGSSRVKRLENATSQVAREILVIQEQSNNIQ